MKTPPDLIDFSARMRWAMARCQMTQSELGRRAKVKRQTVNAWLTGRSAGIEGETLINVASALGVKSEWLRKGVGAHEPMQPERMLGDDFRRLAEAWLCLRSAQRESFLAAVCAAAEENRATVMELGQAILRGTDGGG
jgi:transcriptional regulator with XRE-family HTH domain